MDFTIFAKDTNAAKEVVSTLKAEVASGKLGSFAVDNLTLQVPSTPEPQPTAGTAQTNPSWFSKLLSSLCFICDVDGTYDTIRVTYPTLSWMGGSFTTVL